MKPYTDLRPNASRLSPQALLGLQTPLALFIESTNVCNFRCPICTQSDPQFPRKAGYYQRMPERIWREVLRQTREAGWRYNVVRFYGIGEPLLAPDLPDMINAFGGVAVRTEISTNGVYLGCKAESLLESGLDYVRVSVYHTTDDGYRRESGSTISATHVLESVRSFRACRDAAGMELPRICAKLTTADADWDRFVKQYTGVADDLQMERPYNWGSTKDRLVQLAPSPEAPRKCCPKPFFELMVKANGDVSACCVDWAGELNIGNVMNDSLPQIWKGQNLQDVRRAHLNGRRFEMPACSNCDLPEVTPDDMDSLF